MACSARSRHPARAQLPAERGQDVGSAPLWTTTQLTRRRYNEDLCALGIRRSPTMIASPEQIGIMERFFGSLKDERVEPRATTLALK
jgi:transposase InsO family protein